jgi:succinate-semialdehyde dehydrogenase/glutarate-semialdehyde dehydrogenase
MSSTLAAPGRVTTVDPATGKPLETYAEHDWTQIDAKLEGARETFRCWRGTTNDDRESAL